MTQGRAVKTRPFFSQVETVSADKLGMEQLIYGVLSVIFFCLCCHLFIRNLTAPIPLLVTERVYARSAMQLGKVYKTLAWGTMSGFFLVVVIMSFSQVFTTL